MLGTGDIAAFKAIYFDTYGQEISNQEAGEQAQQLLNLFKNIYVPMTQEQFDSIELHREQTLTTLHDSLITFQ